MSARKPALSRCVPSTGQHPGELHESLISWIDPQTSAVLVTVRHLASGDVSEVELFKTCFGERALAAAAVIEAGLVAADAALAAADAALCRWDEARARSVITPDSWRRGMALDVPISRRLVASGSVAVPHPLQDGAAAECSPAHQQAITCESVDSICPWCVIERAMNGQGAAPRTGFVAVARCERHSAESPVLLAPTSPTPPGAGHALSHATASGFPSNPNPNAGAVQAFPKGRWS